MSAPRRLFPCNQNTESVIPRTILSNHHMNNLYKQGNVLHNFPALTLSACSTSRFWPSLWKLHFSLTIGSVHRRWCWNFTLRTGPLSMVLNQHRTAWVQRHRLPQREKNENFAGWMNGWSSLDFVSAGTVCKWQTRQSLSRQGAPRPVCFRAVTCDSVIYKEMGSWRSEYIP